MRNIGNQLTQVKYHDTPVTYQSYFDHVVCRQGCDLKTNTLSKYIQATILCRDSAPSFVNSKSTPFTVKLSTLFLIEIFTSYSFQWILSRRNLANREPNNNRLCKLPHIGKCGQQIQTKNQELQIVFQIQSEYSFHFF